MAGVEALVPGERRSAIEKGRDGVAVVVWMGKRSQQSMWVVLLLRDATQCPKRARDRLSMWMSIVN